MQVTYRKTDKTLCSAGWIEIRCKGDHHQYKHPQKGLVVTVPGKRGSDVLSPNVIKQIERTTGLSLRR